ncbi:MAG: FecR domain-containing protein [Burkholderiaceae bacterium]|nr:FecR domain-containing protein [Burkholderiaceae bacterium]
MRPESVRHHAATEIIAPIAGQVPTARRGWGWVLAVIVLAILALLVGEHARSASPAAEVLAAQGDSRLLRPGSIKSPIRPGTRVISGDVLKTGPDGSIQLRFADGAAISLGASTEFRVEEYRFEPKRQRAFFELVRGFARTVSGMIGKKRHEDFRLKTATAVMGIRGTDFATEQGACATETCSSTDARGLKVTVYEGVVAVSNGAGTVDVPRGKTLFVGGRTSAPQFVSAPAGSARRAGASSGTSGRAAPGRSQVSAPKSTPDPRDRAARPSGSDEPGGPQTMRFVPR